jgi:bifunctional DNA-binding transcriptional regulator/antitoxin component of YhaV-PrlF toxin-antitoxin module
VRFRTAVELSGRTATGLPVPDDVVAALGKGRRPPVRVTIGAYSFHTTIGIMGGRSLIPLSAQHRDAAGIHPGDMVTVDLDADDQPQESAVPTDLATKLNQDPEARRFFDSLSTSQRREWIRWIEDAKRAPTRQARIAAAIDALHAGKKRH